MTEAELYNLRLDKNYHFHLYYGVKLFGYAQREGNSWYIVRPTTETKGKKASEVGRLVLPAQIIDCYEWNGESVSPKDNSVIYKNNISFKTLVILGAGASHDYCFQPNQENKPPLTRDLFCDNYTETIGKFTGVENLSSQLQQADDIEAYFQRQWDKVFKSHNQQLLNKLIDVQFYLHYLFRNVSSQPNFSHNNYSAFFQFLFDDLISKGQNEKALVVSFNYDTLLEKSLTKALSYEYNSMDDYIDQSRRLLVLKPHGSCNWVRTIDPEFCKTLDPKGEPIMDKLHQNIYKNGVSLGHLKQHLSDDIALVSDFNMWNNYYFPELLIPYKNKDSFVMPDKHTNSMDAFLPQVENIFVIGWKGAEEKFKTKLKEKLGHKKIHVRYVNNNDKTIENELTPFLPHAIFTEVAPYENSLRTFTGLNKEILDLTNFFETTQIS